ncbi:MAG: UTP--glucose-1-phosphate uridylyltransferase GalU [Acutalibacteraceae bacterium]|nr:UTP--glucose-1-phosphate uridylyltransferase GalU [Acutalibacteraceae bacterium]
MKKVTKAIIPAAGLGTRMLPASKAIPKEMLPIVDKPAIQYIVEEAVAAGITDILIITNRGKEAMENHFDHNFEMEHNLREKGNTEMLKVLEDVAKLANVTFLRQKETGGLGDAVYKAKSFVGDEPFAVLYGDDVVIGKTPAISELLDVYNQYGGAVVGVKQVSKEQILKYCTLDVTMLTDKVMEVHDMIEKPSPEQIMSLYAILGRCILTPEIFTILENIPKGAGGELQLTDAMAEFARTNNMHAVEFSGKRYDMGSKLGFLIANIEQGLNHDEISDDFKDYLKQLVSKF